MTKKSVMGERPETSRTMTLVARVLEARRAASMAKARAEPGEDGFGSVAMSGMYAKTRGRKSQEKKSEVRMMNDERGVRSAHAVKISFCTSGASSRFIIHHSYF
jgi:hypothetical protein